MILYWLLILIHYFVFMCRIKDFVINIIILLDSVSFWLETSLLRRWTELVDHLEILTKEYIGFKIFNVTNYNLRSYDPGSNYIRSLGPRDFFHRSFVRFGSSTRVVQWSESVHVVSGKSPHINFNFYMPCYVMCNGTSISVLFILLFLVSVSFTICCYFYKTSVLIVLYVAHSLTSVNSWDLLPLLKF